MSASVVLDGLSIHHTGPGPYVARSASDHNPEWPVWIVFDSVGFNGISIQGSIAKFFNRDDALMIANALNGARDEGE
ncbi:hypothetical protein D3C73_668760 [compost metagenome]